jgi:hypothetical protein
MPHRRRHSELPAALEGVYVGLTRTYTHIHTRTHAFVGWVLLEIAHNPSLHYTTLCFSGSADTGWGHTHPPTFSLRRAHTHTLSLLVAHTYIHVQS